MRFIGITGGVGSGKSRILQYIKEHYDARIYLADQVAMELQRKGAVCFPALVNLLGEDILGADGEIDRPAMAAKIFGDPDLLLQVNDIVHPAVREFLLQKLEEARRDGVELFFVEAALLIECGYKSLVDEMWVIFAKKDVREKRLAKDRGYSPEKIENIMKSQLSEEEFLQEADVVIENSGTLEEAFLQIREKLEGYKWHN